jgi:uncharacterized protein DUF4157
VARDRVLTDQERLEQPDLATTPAPPPAALRLAAAVGNRSFAQLARHGVGILPSGRVHPDVQACIDRRRGGGAPLDATTRTEMATVLGDSLADVRVHADAEAGTLARSVDARAFTTGSDIFFGASEYRPSEPAGKHLLAHELTHVVQQRGAPVSGPMEVTQPGDAYEIAADAVADGLGR